MSKKRSEQSPRLEEGLLNALTSIDKQVSRDLLRTPEERETLGSRKWEPYQKRIEKLTSYLIERVGEEDCSIDGLLVLSQALVKTLAILGEELGAEGLGKMRSEYVIETLQKISDDAGRALRELETPGLQ